MSAGLTFFKVCYILCFEFFVVFVLNLKKKHVFNSNYTTKSEPTTLSVVVVVVVDG